MEFGSTSSLESLVLADELIAMSRQFVEGIPVTPSTLALDVIERVAKSSENATFLADEHTYENFREAHFMPRLLDRRQYEVWAADGSEDTYTRCNKEARRLLEEHQVDPKPADILNEIENVLNE
jgi:trimethylamine--corrinoid protein Co-methyltransferase